MSLHLAQEETGALSTSSCCVLLEDTWEADDIKDECSRVSITCRELSVGDIEEVNAIEFSKSTFMCNTELTQRKLREAGLLNKVPSTYPNSLQNLLKRSVKQRILKTISVSDLPIFIKPVSNDKSFDGRVVQDMPGLASLREEAGDGECLVWVAEKVCFLVEHRLFVGGGELYGTGRIQGKGDAVPPESFVREVLACCGVDVFWAVDVGLMTPLPGTGEGGGGNRGQEEGSEEECWAVVEVNPPFALDDHGLAIEPYCRYCRDACAWLRRP